MERRWVWYLSLAAVGGLIFAGVLLAMPARANAQPDDGSGRYEAMHAACLAGDAQAMRQAMDSLSDEDWEAMGDHMRDGRQGGMGPGRMVSSWMGSGMMGGRGMMGSGGMMHQ